MRMTLKGMVYCRMRLSRISFTKPHDELQNDTQQNLTWNNDIQPNNKSPLHKRKQRRMMLSKMALSVTDCMLYLQ